MVTVVNPLGGCFCWLRFLNCLLVGFSAAVR
jgi:hypothetical protein